jgi:glutamate carboxypeptidase
MNYFTPETSAKIRAYLEANLSRYMEMLRRMVEINSYTKNPDGVNRLGDLTDRIFQDLGFSAERVVSVNPAFGSHLVLTRRGPVAFTAGCVSHLDTVYSSEEEEANDFRWHVRNNRAYGPGTVDIKGGTVLMCMVLEALHHAAPSLFEGPTWVLLLDASEEMESDDFGALCRERLGGGKAACLVFEAGVIRKSGYYLVSSRKGKADFRITSHGRGAHSGVAHRRGASAIVQIGDVIREMERLTDYSRSLTVNVGSVSGGSVVNRVPQYAEAFAEMRAFSPDVFEEALDEVLKLNSFSSVSSADGKFSCSTSVEMLRRVPAWPENQGSAALLEFWRRAGVLLGVEVFPESRGGLSDGNFTWDQVPTIDGLGPSGGNPHCSEQSIDGSKEQEYVRISSFVPKALLNAMALVRMIESF